MSRVKSKDEVSVDLRDELSKNDSHESRVEALLIEMVRLLRVIAKVQKPQMVQTSGKRQG